MSCESSECREVGFCDTDRVVQRRALPLRPRRGQHLDSPWSYEVRRGKRPFKLSGIEWRILKFLSSRPYHAFTPRCIADAVTTDSQPVTEQSLRVHIASLRQKLGLFADYVQSVPHIGYRFKE